LSRKKLIGREALNSRIDGGLFRGRDQNPWESHSWISNSSAEAKAQKGMADRLRLLHRLP